jgi:hypothetical protein
VEFPPLPPRESLEAGNLVRVRLSSLTHRQHQDLARVVDPHRLNNVPFTIGEMVQEGHTAVLRNERSTASRLLAVHATDRLEMIVDTPGSIIHPAGNLPEADGSRALPERCTGTRKGGMVVGESDDIPGIVDRQAMRHGRARGGVERGHLAVFPPEGTGIVSAPEAPGHDPAGVDVAGPRIRADERGLAVAPENCGPVVPFVIPTASRAYYKAERCELPPIFDGSGIAVAADESEARDESVTRSS